MKRKTKDSAAVIFDTHQLVKDLEAKGFNAEQAEGINDALKGALTIAEVATKRDLKELEVILKHDLREMELRMTIRLGTLIFASLGLMAAVQKVFFS